MENSFEKELGKVTYKFEKKGVDWYVYFTEIDGPGFCTFTQDEEGQWKQQAQGLPLHIQDLITDFYNAIEEHDPSVEKHNVFIDGHTGN